MLMGLLISCSNTQKTIDLSRDMVPVSSTPLQIVFSKIQKTKTQISVEGTILVPTDKSKAIFANIIVQGTNIGTTRDENGNFELNELSPKDTLVVNYIGYPKKKISVNQIIHFHKKVW